jgi:DNA (cytosine-5)-methyltransferase 1
MSIKVLNLYAGVGGNRKLWENVEVTAVENGPKIAAAYAKQYPQDTLIVGDAHQYLLENADNFDVVWSSPPCQSHSKMVKFTRHKIRKYPDMSLYEEIIFLQNFYKGRWVVENVVPYYTPLIAPTLKLGRHIFWSSSQLGGGLEIKSPPNMINKTRKADRQAMLDWLGIEVEEVIYYRDNHCPLQVLRNCVHPKIGKFIFDQL